MQNFLVLLHKPTLLLLLLPPTTGAPSAIIDGELSTVMDAIISATYNNIDAVTSDINFVAPSSHEIILTFDLFTNKRTLRSPRYF